MLVLMPSGIERRGKRGQVYDTYYLMLIDTSFDSPRVYKLAEVKHYIEYSLHEVPLEVKLT